MKKITLIIFGISLFVLCCKKKDKINPELVKEEPKKEVVTSDSTQSDSTQVTTCDSAEIFDGGSKIYTIKYFFKDSKLTQTIYEFVNSNVGGGLKGHNFDYGDDQLLDSMTERYSGAPYKMVGDRFIYDGIGNLLFVSYYNTEYAYKYKYLQDSIIVLRYNNPCSGFPNICEITPNGYSMNTDGSDTLIFNGQDVKSKNGEIVTYLPASPVFSHQDIYKLYATTGDRNFLYMLLGNAKLIQSIGTSSYGFTFDSKGRVSELTLPTSLTGKIVFHYCN